MYCKRCGNKMVVINKKMDMWYNFDSQYECPKCKHSEWDIK